MICSRDHQNHYEQFGRLSGSVRVDGGAELALSNLNVMRDHTVATKRDWRLMHRYAFHFFSTATGYRGVVGVVCQPPNFTHLELGYIYTPSNKVFPVQAVDFQV